MSTMSSPKSRIRRSQTPTLSRRSPSPSLHMSTISNRSNSPTVLPKPIRDHDSHPITATHPQDMPGPGTYNPNTSCFDSPAAFKHVLRGPSLSGKAHQLAPTGSDSPGPKYNLNNSLRQNAITGGSWCKQRRFVRNEVAPGCRKNDSPGPGEYNGRVGESTMPRIKGGMSFAPPITVARKSPEKVVDKNKAARLWKEKLKGIEAKERMEAGDDTFSVPVPHSKAQVRMGPEKAPPCTFGRRLSDKIPVTPGPGTYEGTKNRQSTKEYSFLRNSGHGSLLGRQDPDMQASVGSYDPLPDVTRPHSPTAVLYLTG